MGASRDDLWDATTRELLVEVALRMEYQQNSNSGRDLGILARQAVENLDGFVLDHHGGDWTDEQKARLFGSDAR